MHKKRLEKLLEVMQKEGIDGAFFATGPNFQYLLDARCLKWQRLQMNNIADLSSAITVPDCLLYVESTGKTHLFVIPDRVNDFTDEENIHVYYLDRMCDGVERVVKGSKFAIDVPCRKYIEEMIEGFGVKPSFVDGEELMRPFRMIKDEEEIETLEANARFTDEAIKWLISQFKEGMSQYEAEDLLMQYAFDKGCPDFAFDPTVGFITRGEKPTEEPSFDHKRTLVSSTGIAFDIGFVRDGYCSDWGRTVFYGKAPALLKDGYVALQAGQISMIEHIVPYKTNINELYGFVAEEVEKRGYSDYLRYKDIGALGHQIGIECHEFPMLNNSVDCILKPGMVFCSEPKLWFPGEIYMRVEDMVLVTETGARSLSVFDRELFEI